MPLHLIEPLLSALVTAALAAAILARDPARRANRLAAALLGGGTFWSVCSVLWNASADAAVALRMIRLSALGWVWMGPLTLHLFLELTGDPAPRLRRSLPLLYATSAGLIVVDWTTPWVHAGVVHTSFGWGSRLGAAAAAVYAFSLGCLVVALRLGARSWGRSASPAEREQARWISLGFFVPLVLSSVSDMLLPLAGVRVPRLGTASVAVLGALMFWSFRRYGDSLLAPGDFATEILATLPDGVALLRPDGSVRSANAAMLRLLEPPGASLAGVRLPERLSLALDFARTVEEQRCELASFGGRRVPVAVTTRPLHDRKGLPLGTVVVARDLAEVVSLRDRLVLSARLAAVGELAAGIAHEINNPLAFVRANLSLLREHWAALLGSLDKAESAPRAAELGAEGEELIDESLEGVARVSSIVRDVRGLARGGDGRRSLADLHALLDGVLRMTAPQLRTRARVEKRYGPPAWVLCAPEELQQVFVNLVLNAAHALGESGTIGVATRRDGDRVVVDVEDDGSGIEPSRLGRIFDPFFTTKAVGEGSGLGLAIAHGIVASHGGEIRVVSEPGRGSRFSVHLPLATDTIEPDDGT